MSIRSIIFVLFFFCTQHIYAQSTIQQDTLLASKYVNTAERMMIKQQDTAIVYFLKAAQLYKKQSLWDNYYSCFEGISFCHKLQGTWHKYLKYEPELVKDLEKKPYTRTYISLAIAHREKDNYEQALVYFNRGLEEIYKSEEIDSIDLAVIYNDLGVTYRLQGDFELSLEYYKKVLNLYKNIPATDSIQIARTYSNIGNAYSSLEDYKQAIFYFNKAVNAIEKMASSTSKTTLLTRVYHNLILAYQKNKQFDEAAIIIEKFFQLPKKNIQKFVLIYRDLGISQLHFKQKEKALESFFKGLKISNETYSFKHPKKAIFYNQIAKVYSQQNEFEKALLNHQKALNNLTLDSVALQNPFPNPSLQQIISKIDLLRSLGFKIETLQKKYQQTQDLPTLKAIYQTCQLTDSLIVKMRQSYKAEGSKNYLAKNALSTYEGAIKTALLLYEKTKDPTYQEAAFTFAEKNKATILLESLQDNKAKFQHIPEHLIVQEKELSQEIIFAEKKLYEIEKKQDQKAEKEKWQNQLFTYKRKREKLLQEFAQKYPSYFSLKFNTQISSIKSIQENLQADQAILEYFVGDSIIYTFLIQKADFNTYSLKKPDAFQKTIQQYRKAISNIQFINDSTTLAQIRLYQQGNQLYEWLLSDPLSHLSINVDRLIIIPDDLLGYINFEALPQSKEKNASFLIQDYNISQAYSATLLQEQLQTYTKATTEDSLIYAGFAPQYPKNFTIEPTTRNEKLADLPHARKAVEILSKQIKGEQWIGPAATEENFKKYAPKYKLLHLAMHGIIDDENPLFSKLIFTPNTSTNEDDQLHANELYNIKLNAHLAVLSACNTGVGQLKKGEGIMSLSRAFTYAGCPSLVISLWSIPSKASANIISQFHLYLKEGQNIDDALKQAKLHYLENASQERKHPYFWAGFTLIGDSQAFIKKSNNYSYKWLLLLLPFLLIFVVKYRF